MNQLGKELQKLEELAPMPVDLSFLIGYLSYPLPHDQITNFRPALKELLNYRDDSLITSHNILELIVVLKYKILVSEPKRLISSIQHYAGELICDNKYLYSKFFEEKVVVEKQKEGLGIECSICTVEIDAKTICYLSCNHMYHRQCFNEYAKEQIAKKSIPLKCPTEECHLELKNQEITEFLPKDLKDKYEEFMFQNYVDEHMDDTSWCPTPGCKAVFAFDFDLDNYRCPSCKKHYCLRCKCQMHVGVTCKEYQQLGDMSETDKKFMVLVKGSKYKQCPNCKFWVQKNEGCDHMTCRCKYQFCYICGGKYGACSCVGLPRMPMPRHLPMPMPVPRFVRPPEYDYQDMLNPRLIRPIAPLRPPHMLPLEVPPPPYYQSQQQYRSDEELPQQIYNSLHEEQRRQEQEFKQILRKIEEMSKLEFIEKQHKEQIKAQNLLKPKYEKQQIKRQKKQELKKQIRQQIKRQIKQQIKRQLKQQIKSQTQQKIQVQKQVSKTNISYFNFSHKPKPKQRQQQ